MKAMLYREAGGPEVFEYTDVPDPEPGAGDVVIDGSLRARLEGLSHALTS